MQSLTCVRRHTPVPGVFAFLDDCQSSAIVATIIVFKDHLHQFRRVGLIDNGSFDSRFDMDRRGDSGSGLRLLDSAQSFYEQSTRQTGATTAVMAKERVAVRQVKRFTPWKEVLNTTA